MRRANLITVGLLLASLTACAPPYKKAFDDTAAEQNWTKKQELAAYAYADKIFWAKETQEGSGQYVFVYSRVPISKVAAQIKQTLDDFDAIQNPKYPEWTTYGKVYGLTDDFKHEEDIERTIYARVHAADEENNFKIWMGDQSPYGPEAEAHRGYNLRRIFTNKPLAEAFPFTSDQIESAKKNGTLKVIEDGSFNLGSQMDHKSVNPENPTDASDFVWKPRQISIELINYKIIDTEKPLDNHGNYIEGFRFDDHGKAESVPCIKIFFPPDGSMAIVMLETTRQGEPGYGVPDVMERLYGVDNLQEIVANGQILNAIFAEKKEDKRRIPEPKVFKVEISRMDQPISPWQQAPDANGFLVPMKYRDSSGSNYNIRIKYALPNVDVNNTDAVVAAHDGFQNIEWIAKEYTRAGNQYEPSAGQVIEYYKPKVGFDKRVKARVVFDQDTKKVEFSFPDGTVTYVMITPGDNKVIESSPTAVAYTEGEKRYWMEKTSGSKVYDRRKQVSPPREATGVYDTDTSVFDMAPRRAGSNGPTEGDKPYVIPNPDTTKKPKEPKP